MVHQLLTRFVDDEVISRIAVEDIERFDKSFVSDAFLDRESDVIYRVTTGGGEVYIYVLIEPTIASRHIPSFEYYPIVEGEISNETLERVRGILSAVMYLEKRRDDAEPDVPHCGEETRRETWSPGSGRPDAAKGARGGGGDGGH